MNIIILLLEFPYIFLNGGRSSLDLWSYTLWRTKRLPESLGSYRGTIWFFETRGFCKENAWGHWHWCNFGSNLRLVCFFLEKTAELDWLGCYSAWELLENVGKSSTCLFGLPVSHNFHVLGLCHALPFGQQKMTRSLLRPSRCLPQGTRRSKMKRLCFFFGGRSNSRQKSRFSSRVYQWLIITVSTSTSRHFYHLSLSFHPNFISSKSCWIMREPKFLKPASWLEKLMRSRIENHENQLNDNSEWISSRPHMISRHMVV